MSAILALVGPGARTASDERVRCLLASMAYRGSECVAVWRSPSAVLAVARDRWETDPGFAGGTLVATRGAVHVVCDATLYYKRDLVAALRSAGVVPESDSAADLIAAAYVAFGPRLVDHVEGDFAFCIWDDAARTLLCARDPFGARSLYHTELDGTRLIASTPHALVAHRGERAAFDAIGVLRGILGRDGDGTATGWKDVSEIPAAHTLTVTPERTTVARYWAAQGADRWRALSSAEAAGALWHLLAEAAKERHHPAGAALSLSGGQDSTAILAALEPGSAAALGPLHIVSLKYPPGSSGNEDWYVNRVAEMYRLPVHWVDTDGIGLFDDVLSRARFWSGCTGHFFEGQNRALARAALGLGNRIILNGHGGDNLFAINDWRMADLLRQGRWIALRRYWARRGYRGVRQFLKHCVRPALPFWIYDAAERVTGREFRTRPFERPVPRWIRADAGMLAQIKNADRADHARTIVRRYPTVLERYRAWALMYSAFPRICAALFDLSRHEGVEVRMPFYDRRLVEFALSRPAWDLSQPGRVKVILNRAVRERLPERTWTPQAGGHKPGTANDYVEQRFGAETAALVATLSDRRWVSEEAGLLDRNAFIKELAARRADANVPRIPFSLTLLAEVWLRAHDRAGAASAF